jgi:hypothetical protein
MGNILRPKSKTWSRTPMALTAAPQGEGPYIPCGQYLSVFTTVIADSGAVLPGSGVGFGEKYVVANHGANPLLVYPELGGEIGRLGADAPIEVAAGKTCEFRSVGENQWCYMGGA